MAENRVARGQTWFSREGEIYGPFNEVEVERLKEEGEYEKFSWMWGPMASKWTAINPPPRPPIEDFSESTQDAEEPQEEVQLADQGESQQTFQGEPPPVAVQPVEAQKPEAPKTTSLSNALQALCHDQKTIISGKIESVFEDGFVMTSKDYSTSSPPFHQGWTIWLNLLDESQGCTENIRAKIVKISRQDDATWAYEFQWEEAPKIMQL